MWLQWPLLMESNLSLKARVNSCCKHCFASWWSRWGDRLLARVGEGIVTSIAFGKRIIKSVLENPIKSQSLFWPKGLECRYAFEILSIDIGRYRWGTNRSKNFKLIKLLRILKVAEGKAEERRADAGLRVEQENEKLKIVEMRAKVIEAEAESQEQ